MNRVIAERIPTRRVIAERIPTQYEIKRKVSEVRTHKADMQRPLAVKIIKPITKSSSEIVKYIEKTNTNTTKKDDIIIGGSGAAWMQVRTFRTPKDLDIETQTPQKHAKNIIKILKEKYRHVSKRPTFITKEGVSVTQISIHEDNVIDIKTHQRTGTPLKIVDGFTFPTQQPKTVKHQLFVPLNELFARKGKAINESYYQKKKEHKRIPDRIEKDIADFRSIYKVLK